MGNDKWSISPNDKQNFTKRFYKVSSSKVEAVSAPPNATGLFGRSLSWNSRLLLGDRPETGFRFKASAYDDPYRMLSEGHPYNYVNDLDYNNIVGEIRVYRKNGGLDNKEYLNALFKHGLILLPEFITDFSYFGRGPKLAQEPRERDPFGYIWPSYVIWYNDPSYTSFSGSPDYLEIPKHVLRKTRGHPQQNKVPAYGHRPRIYNKWEI